MKSFGERRAAPHSKQVRRVPRVDDSVIAPTPFASRSYSVGTGASRRLHWPWSIFPVYFVPTIDRMLARTVSHAGAFGFKPSK